MCYLSGNERPELNAVFHTCLHQSSMEGDFQLSAPGIDASANVDKTP